MTIYSNGVKMKAKCQGILVKLYELNKKQWKATFITPLISFPLRATKFRSTLRNSIHFSYAANYR